MKLGDMETTWSTKLFFYVTMPMLNGAAIIVALVSLALIWGWLWS